MQDVVLGACVGDAVGAPVEFLKPRPIPVDLLKDALRMKGGGFLDLKAGQITDDGELTICLATALKNNQDPMKYYEMWLNTEPVDVGTTTRFAIVNKKPDSKTEANGALMRCSPIPAFYYNKLSLIDIANHARDEASRTHSSTICKECNAIYCVAIAYLLKARATSSNIDIDDLFEEVKKHTRNLTVLTWLEESKQKPLLLQEQTNYNIGWVRWGFTLAFHHLRYKTNYRDAIIDVIKSGGDTDTNAAITGALLGALWGVKGIPKMWLNKVLSCDVRPQWLRPSLLI